MERPSVRGKLRLMASNINFPQDNNNVTFGLIKAQQELEMISLCKTLILANAILKNDKKTNELVNQVLNLIYFEDDHNKVSDSDANLLSQIRNMAFRIDTSSIPMEQDKLVRKK